MTLLDKLVELFNRKKDRTQQQVWNDNEYIEAVVKHKGFLWHCLCITDLDPPKEKMHTIEQSAWLNRIVHQASDATLADRFNYHGTLIGIVRTCILAHYGYEAVPDADIPFIEVFKTEYDYKMNNYRSGLR